MKSLKPLIPYAKKLLLILVIAFLIFQTYALNKEISENRIQCNDAKKVSNNNVQNSNDISDLPELKLPIKYFPKSSISWGNLGSDLNTSNPGTWEIAAVDIGSRGVPTTNITLSKDDYSNKQEDLPPLKTYAQIVTESKEISYYDELRSNLDIFYKDIYAQSGNFGTRFLPGFYARVDEFDVDSDGINEKIVYLCGIGGTHCPHIIDIVDNDKIIFSVHAGIVELNLTASETGDGFYVKWVPTTGNGWENYAECCEPGYMKTRFVYKNNEFVPVYEQEYRYVEVVNTE